MQTSTTSHKARRSSRTKKMNAGTLKIDMRDLHSHGFGHDKALYGTLSIDGDDKAICIITASAMNVMYRFNINGRWKYLKQKITLNWTFQADNSRNAYFICPECGKRTLVLHHHGKSFACRKCSKLTIKTNCSQYKFIPYAA